MSTAQMAEGQWHPIPKGGADHAQGPENEGQS